jgi:hypothetical protein
MERDLSPPTKKQSKEFAQYVCLAHSWYKHIPLLEGAQFVFFFSQEAGKGYSKEQPRLHYTWKTTEEYRQRFGYLDYMYRFDGEQSFDRDGKAHPFIPSSDLLAHCGITLYPYVSHECDVVASLMADECFDTLHANTNHPRYKAVLQWYEAHVHQEDEWDDLSESEQNIASEATQDIAFSWDEEQHIDISEELAKLPIKVASYVQRWKKATGLYVALQESELAKIKSALTRLCELSKTGVQVWW